MDQGIAGTNLNVSNDDKLNENRFNMASRVWDMLELNVDGRPLREY